MNQKNNKIVWPASTMNGNERNNENVTEISNKIEAGQSLSIEESKGINGRSLFLDIPYFNIALDFPAEYLHSTCLGLGKRTLQLTFDVGESRQRNTTRKLSSTKDFNKLMSKIQVFRECSRRARNLDFSVMKGQEYRNILLFYFKLVVNCIEEDEQERKLWFLFAYMIRSCVLPNNEYQNIDPAVVQYCAKCFYELYEQLFGARNCSYNTHVVLSHINKIRVHGPLTLTSAFGFESFYGELRNSFTPGTTSPLKQIMSKIIIKRTISPHCCRPTIFYSAKETPLESNAYIYTFKDNEYFFHKIVHIESDTFYCNNIEKLEATFPEIPTLNWSKVGVFTAGQINQEITIVEKEDIAGKIMRVDNLLITCPINVLEEK